MTESQIPETMNAKWKSCWNRFLREEWHKGPVAMLMAIFSVVVGIGSILISSLTLNEVKRPPYDMVLGVVPSRADMVGKHLIVDIQQECDEINKKLRSAGVLHRIVVDNELDKYDALKDRLVNGKVDMGYLPMGVFHAWMALNPSSFGDFEIVGYKQAAPVRDPNGETSAYYKGVLVWNRDSELARLCAKNDWKAVKSQLDEGKCRICLGDKSSMSSNIIQRIFLARYGVVLNDDGMLMKPPKKENGVVFDKQALVDRILKPDSCDIPVIGAISEDDWSQLSDTLTVNRLDARIISIPIPYDIVVINRKRWKKISSGDRTTILNTIGNRDNNRKWKIEYNKTNDDQAYEKMMQHVKFFGLLMRSAIICEHGKNDSMIFLKARRPLDIAPIYNEWFSMDEGKNCKALVFIFDYSNDVTNSTRVEHLLKADVTSCGGRIECSIAISPENDALCRKISDPNCIGCILPETVYKASEEKFKKYYCK